MEKNRENYERKRANKIMKHITKSNEPFRCPWCPWGSAMHLRSGDILQHMFVILIKLGLNLLIKCDHSAASHVLKKALSNMQVKSLKRAHQDELVEKLKDLSIP